LPNIDGFLKYFDCHNPQKIRDKTIATNPTDHFKHVATLPWEICSKTLTNFGATFLWLSVVRVMVAPLYCNIMFLSGAEFIKLCNPNL